MKQRLQNSEHLILDGTVLHRRGNDAIYALMDCSTNTLVYAAYGVREGAKDLQRLYKKLAQAGLTPKSATIDGNPQQAKYLSLQWPQIVLQRCIVHVQRQGLRWCRRRPTRTDAKHLQRLYFDLMEVKTPHDRERYIRRVEQWDQRFGSAIRQARRITGGWVFSDLVLAARMIVRALPDMFHFINEPTIAFSTNALEGYFSRLKEKYRGHRGLLPTHRERYFQWYFHLQPR